MPREYVPESALETTVNGALKVMEWTPSFKYGIEVP